MYIFVFVFIFLVVMLIVVGFIITLLSMSNANVSKLFQNWRQNCYQNLLDVLGLFYPSGSFGGDHMDLLRSDIVSLLYMLILAAAEFI